MPITRAENRKLPAWIGSILFHTILFLILLLWFSLSSTSNRGAPGERIASGTILFSPSDGGGQQTTDETADDRQEVVAEEVAWGQLADINLSNLPTTLPTLSGSNQRVALPGGASVGDLTGALQRDTRLGSGKGAGTGNGETTVSVFGTGGKGMTFLYVFDRSTSMEGAPIRAAKGELIRSLDSLGDSHQFNIIFYSSKDHWQLWQPGRVLVYATAANKRNAEGFVAGIAASGGTRHYEPLVEAIRHRPDVIFFLTDGESHDDLTIAELSAVEQANSRWGRGSQINVIQFGAGGLTSSESRSLQQLAEQNFGEYRYYNVTTWK